MFSSSKMRKWQIKGALKYCNEIGKIAILH